MSLSSMVVRFLKKIVLRAKLPGAFMHLEAKHIQATETTMTRFLCVSSLKQDVQRRMRRNKKLDPTRAIQKIPKSYSQNLKKTQQRLGYFNGK